MTDRIEPVTRDGASLADLAIWAKACSRPAWRQDFLPMNPRQRTVIVIASGFAIASLISAVNRVWATDGLGDGGWFNYAPNNGVTFSAVSDQGWIWREAALWLIGITIWAGLAFWIYRDRDPKRSVPSAD
jgi:hypothetical protein